MLNLNLRADSVDKWHGKYVLSQVHTLQSDFHPMSHGTKVAATLEEIPSSDEDDDVPEFDNKSIFEFEDDRNCFPRAS